MAQQVRFDVRLIDAEDGQPITISSIPHPVYIACDALDSVIRLETDSACRVQTELPVGRCIVWPLYYNEIVFDLRGDTSLDLHVISPFYNDGHRYLYRSRHFKDSTLRADEAELLANLNAKDTVYP